MASDAGKIYMTLCDLVGKDVANDHWRDDDVDELIFGMMESRKSNRQIALAVARLIQTKQQTTE